MVNTIGNKRAIYKYKKLFEKCMHGTLITSHQTACVE